MCIYLANITQISLLVHIMCLYNWLETHQYALFMQQITLIVDVHSE